MGKEGQGEGRRKKGKRKSDRQPAGLFLSFFLSFFFCTGDSQSPSFFFPFLLFFFRPAFCLVILYGSGRSGLASCTASFSTIFSECLQKRHSLSLAFCWGVFWLIRRKKVHIAVSVSLSFFVYLFSPVWRFKRIQFSFCFESGGSRVTAVFSISRRASVRTRFSPPLCVF